MIEDSNKGRREQFEEEAERIRNSDRGTLETANAISEARGKYYSSKWEKLEEDRKHMADYKRYTFIIGSGLLFSLLGGYIFGSSGAIIAAIIGILVASAYMTKPGLRFMEGFGQLSEEMNGSQQQSNNSVSTPGSQKILCSICGLQNPSANNFCNSCGEQLDPANE